MTTVLQATRRRWETFESNPLRKMVASGAFGYETETTPISLNYRETVGSTNPRLNSVFSIEVDGKKVNAVL